MSGTVVVYAGKLRCRAEHDESGAILVTDALKDNHGLGEGFSPSDLLSVSLGGCILSIMGIAAQSMNGDIARAAAGSRTVFRHGGTNDNMFLATALPASAGW